MNMFMEQVALAQAVMPLEICGRVAELQGLAVRVNDLPVPIGAMVHLECSGQSLMGEVVGFDRQQTLVMPLGPTVGIRRGDRVKVISFAAMTKVGNCLLGRVINALGEPLDEGGAVVDVALRPLQPAPVEAMERPLIDQPLATGVRAIDSLLSVGRGQRLGVFAGPGMGKSTLLGMMIRHTAADVSVVALVGERGREVKDFVDNHLGKEGMKKSVVVVATGDEPALLRIRAALAATSIAEYFRDQGKDVLLIMDSITRFCQAQRQVGLSAGEPPATKGYPPSVFAMLPRLLERSGRTQRGSITGFYSVLMEGDDMNEPIADAARGILDGHIRLSQSLANRGHWPAIDVLESISRVCDAVTSSDQQQARREVLKLVHAYRQVEELLNIGAYAAGSNPEFDTAIACKGAIDQLLQQGLREQGVGDFERSKKLLLALVLQIQHARQQVSKLNKRTVAARPAA